jgi:cytoskeletal protein RodZ
MSEQGDVEEFNTSATEGFGYRLKTVREENKLSLADIASQLRLDENIIQALEEYDYTALPEPMFVCCYIRNYAKLLNIQPEPLVEYYKNDIEGNLIPKLDVKNESRNIRSYRLGKFLPLIFLFVLMVFVFAGWKWWQSHSSQFAGSSGESSVSRWFDLNKNSSAEETESDRFDVDNLEDPNQLQLPEYNEEPLSQEPLSQEPLLPQINETSINNPVPAKEQNKVFDHNSSMNEKNNPL